MFRKKFIPFEIEKMLDDNNENTTIILDVFNKHFSKVQTVNVLKKQKANSWEDPIKNLLKTQFSRVRLAQSIIGYESIVDLNQFSFIESNFSIDRPIFNFSFSEELYPKPQQCIFASREAGTHILNIKNGIVTVPPELMSDKFVLKYVVENGRQIGKTDTLKVLNEYNDRIKNESIKLVPFR